MNDLLSQMSQLTGVADGLKGEKKEGEQIIDTLKRVVAAGLKALAGSKEKEPTPELKPPPMSVSENELQSQDPIPEFIREGELQSQDPYPDFLMKQQQQAPPKSNLELAPVPTPVHATQTPKNPTYRFMNLKEMEESLLPSLGKYWEATVARPPNVFQSILGVTPEDPRIQAEMNRVYNSGSDKAFANSMVDGRGVMFNRLMIKRVD